MFRQNNWLVKATLVVLAALIVLTTFALLIGPLLHEYVIAYSISGPDGVCVLNFRIILGRPWGTPSCISNEHYSGPAEWSPDGSKILYSVNKNQHTGGVYEFQTWGGPTKRLTTFCNGILVIYLVSPDLTHIVFEGAFSQGFRSLLCITDIVAGTTQYIGEGYSPTWSPDGKQLAYVEVNEEGQEFITVVDQNGRHIRTLTQRPAVSLQWSPDGNWILYSRFADTSAAISAVNLKTGETKDVISSVAFGLFPTWSPDGEWIAYLQREQTEYYLYVAHADGTNRRKLTDMDMDSRTDPQWSPDGEWIAVVHDTAIYVVRADTGETIRLTKGARYSHLRWQPKEQ